MGDAGNERSAKGKEICAVRLSRRGNYGAGGSNKQEGKRQRAGTFRESKDTSDCSQLAEGRRYLYSNLGPPRSPLNLLLAWAGPCAPTRRGRLSLIGQGEVLRGVSTEKVEIAAVGKDAKVGTKRS